VVETAGQGIDTVQTNVRIYELSVNVENLAYTGAVSFIGVGNAGDNRITGGARADQLYGRDGNDILTGGLLNELLLGGNGADIFRFVGNDGVDRILDFTSGTDRIELSSATFGTPVFALVQGAGAAVTFALLNPGLTLQTGDFSFG
jgi:serralysin